MGFWVKVYRQSMRDFLRSDSFIPEIGAGINISIAKGAESHYNRGRMKRRCMECKDHRRHACATLRSQRHISLHSTETKCRRLQSALLVVMCIPCNW